jgi:DNA repair protein RecN (Recombination protein N)
MAELPALKLDRADFIIELSSDADNRAEEGIDQIEFWVRTTWALAPDP